MLAFLCDAALLTIDSFFEQYVQYVHAFSFGIRCYLGICGTTVVGARVISPSASKFSPPQKAQ